MDRLLPALAALCLTAFLTGNVQAQITIDADYFNGLIGQVQELSSASLDLDENPDQAALEALSAIVAATGDDQTYDFTDVPFGEPQTATVSFLDYSSDLPGAVAFPEAEAVFVAAFEDEGVVGTGHSYITIADEVYLTHGAWIQGDTDGDGIEETALASTHTPAETTYVFPLTLGTTWSSSYTQDFGGFDAEIAIASTVEGYGMLITPAGSAPALRIRSDRTQTTLGFDFTTTTIDFMTLEGHMASITLGLLDMPEAASYSAVGTTSPVAAEDERELPERVALGQNYPNPFNPATVIPFELSEAGPVSLRIYDVLGREVTTLLDRVLPAGPQEVTWRPAAGLPSGVYLYRLEAAGATQTRTLLLQK